MKIIERRYLLGLVNLFAKFPIVDYWMVFDNSMNPSKFISKGTLEEESKIHDEQIWQKLKSIAYEQNK